MANGDKTILVVDDDVDLLAMVQLVLEAAGYRVLTARDGREALEHLHREMPRVIFLDMKMPGLSGWEFAREFRARYGRRVAIVVLTAAQEARQWALDIEADGYLDKPFDIDDLVRMADRHSCFSS